ALSDKRTLPPKVYGYVVNSLRALKIPVLGSLGILVVLLRIFSGSHSNDRILRPFGQRYAGTDGFPGACRGWLPMTVLFGTPTFGGFGRPNVHVFLLERFNTSAQFKTFLPQRQSAGHDQETGMTDHPVLRSNGQTIKMPTSKHGFRCFGGRKSAIISDRFVNPG